MNPSKAISLLLAGVLVMLGGGRAGACTTGVISGKATLDGRPLLWKNRDAPSKDNQVVHFSDGQYACTAVVNAGQRKAIWMGVNEAGFCIENSVTRDLTQKGAQGLGNGGFMLQALQSCGSVEDFEALLQRTNGKRATNANFGVIDAHGGAAIFETSATAFQKFDANDPDVAPQGYVVRSNFSLTGSPAVDPSDAAQVAEVYSGGRFLRGCRLVDQALADGGASLAYLLQHNTRDLSDAQGTPFVGSINGEIGALPPLLDTSHTISRRSTVSAAVFHGVQPGEDPRLTTMWVMLGEPAFTLAVPCWAGIGEVAPELLGSKTSPLCDAARTLRDQFYVESPSESELAGEGESTGERKSTSEGEGATANPRRLLETALLPDIWARTLPRERRSLQEVDQTLTRWRAGGFDQAEASALHRRLSEQALQELTQLADAVLSVP